MTTGAPELERRLQECMQSHQLTITASPAIVRGTRDAILRKWFLGGRSTTIIASCRVDEANHTVHFRDALAEHSWGISPPTFTIETTKQVGADVRVKHRESGVGGSGAVSYAEVRDDVRALVEAEGWTFDYEVGKAPERA